MSPTEFASIVGSVALLLGSVVAYKKWRPERNDITITSADKVNQMTLRFAGEVNQDNEDLRAKVDAMERAFAQYKVDSEARHAELITELRAKKAEVLHLKDEVARRDTAIVERDEQISELRGRVKRLEDQVASLKASGGPHNL